MKIVLFLLAMLVAAISYVVNWLGIQFGFGLSAYTACVVAWMIWGWR